MKRVWSDLCEVHENCVLILDARNSAWVRMFGTVKQWIIKMIHEWYKRITFNTVLPLITDEGMFSPDLYTCKTSSKASSVLLTLCFSSPMDNTSISYTIEADELSTNKDMLLWWLKPHTRDCSPVVFIIWSTRGFSIVGAWWGSR